MNTPARLGSADRKASDRVTCGWLCAVGLAAAVLGFAGPSGAQGPPPGAPAATESAPAVFSELAGITGVEPGMTAAELITVALDAAHARRLVDAQKILLAVARQDPENVRALQSLGYVYELRATVAKANTADPNAQQRAETFLAGAVKTYLYAAPLALEAGDPQVAERMYNTVLLHEPANAQAQLGLARVLGATDRNLEALERYRTYLKTPAGEKDSRACWELGQIYRSLGYLNQAIRMLERGKELNPEDPEILMELAGTYQDANQPEKALALAESATAKAPRNPAYHNMYAVILLAQSQAQPRGPGGADDARSHLEKAKSEARKAIDLAREAWEGAPEDQELLERCSRYYDTYRQVLGTILRNDRSNTGVRVELARAIQEHAAVTWLLNVRRALAVRAEARGQMSKGTGSSFLPGLAQLRSEEAISFLEALAQLRFDVHVTQRPLGVDDHEAVAETCRKLLKLEPQNAVARRILKQLAAEKEGPPGGSGG